MKLEVGKFYKTRDGGKAYVAGPNPFTDGAGYCWLGAIELFDTVHWTNCGKFISFEESPHDLVAEWIDPSKTVKINGWVNIYPDFVSSHMHPDKAQADKWRVKECIACVEAEIEYTPGQGLNL